MIKTTCRAASKTIDFNLTLCCCAGPCEGGGLEQTDTPRVMERPVGVPLIHAGLFANGIRSINSEIVLRFYHSPNSRAGVYVEQAPHKKDLCSCSRDCLPCMWSTYCTMQLCEASVVMAHRLWCIVCNI